LLHGLNLDTDMDIRIHSTADKDRLSQGVQVRYTTDMELAEKSASGRQRVIAGASAVVENAVAMDAAAANFAAAAMDAAATVAIAGKASPPAITVNDETAAVVPPVMTSGATMVGAAGPGNSADAKPNFHVADSEGAQTSQGH
jgi:hypothetical protein